ncbi:hypothetical protein GCM10022225_58260 [Plantactinospora mayteni]|uniref:SCO6045-like C-terminal domain-containing protein n=1 Tax=Plantactinospora mayteni TaxID=566021 RepID=A0ABQ4F2L3_9ACTN|nr:hypothetical protein [Plantactinospora mayteni]GIH01090.1 hypothetical protein Pma05_76620 [Plantactinospora mayteni]
MTDETRPADRPRSRNDRSSRAGAAGTLADRQAALVAALVAGAPLPPGFDARLVGVARSALLHKRAGEVARHWPLLAAGHGRSWRAVFAAWAAERPTSGSVRDGWDLARHLAAEEALPAPAAEELAVREAGWRYDGHTPPRRRRLPALRRAGNVLVVQFAGRVRIWTAPGSTNPKIDSASPGS